MTKVAPLRAPPPTATAPPPPGTPPPLRRGRVKAKARVPLRKTPIPDHILVMMGRSKVRANVPLGGDCPPLAGNMGVYGDGENPLMSIELSLLNPVVPPGGEQTRDPSDPQALLPSRSVSPEVGLPRLR